MPEELVERFRIDAVEDIAPSRIRSSRWAEARRVGDEQRDFYSDTDPLGFAPASCCTI